MRFCQSLPFFFFRRVVRPGRKTFGPCRASSALIERVPERTIQRTEPEELRTGQHAFLPRPVQESHEPGQFIGGMDAQTLLVQHGSMAFPLLFQLVGKIVVFQKRTGCLLIFLAVGEGNGVEKSDASLLVPARIGQKSDGQSATAGRQALVALKAFAELFCQHPKRFFPVQPGMAPGG